MEFDELAGRGSNVELWETINTSVLVVGSEGAGARAAIEADAAGADVVMTSKGIFGHGGVTLMAPYSCCVAFGHADERDNPMVHFEDTVKGGYYVNDQSLVEKYTHEAPAKMLDLERFGARFAKQPDGRFVQEIMPGHRYPRAIFYDFSTGKQFRNALKKKVSSTGIKVLEDFIVAGLFARDGAISGALGIDIRKGTLVFIHAKAVVISTGGAQEFFYPYTSASNDISGDGLAMALEVGAEAQDLEFMQFFPTGSIWPPILRGNVALGQLRYKCGGLLYNKYGERFMRTYDPVNMEFATRDITARGIVKEILRGAGSPHGGVFLSVNHLPKNIIEGFIEAYMPGYSARGYDLREIGVDIHEDAVEVAPLAHFYMGGIKIDAACSTRVAGLFASGEAAAGVHGANRIEGNALSETQVFGAIAGESAAKYALRSGWQDIDPKVVLAKSQDLVVPLERTGGVKQVEVRQRLQELIKRNAWVVRNGPNLASCLAELESLDKDLATGLCCGNKGREFNREWIEGVEARNMVRVARGLVGSALMRTESRGAHYREDYPDMDNANWLANVIVEYEDGALRFRKEPAVMTHFRPEKVAGAANDATGGAEFPPDLIIE